MKTKIQIKSYLGDLLFEYEMEENSLKKTLEEAVRKKTNLSGANLSGANLSGAYLSGAKNLNKNRVTPLQMLLDQPGQIVAYKLVNEKSMGPFNGGIVYEIGKDYEVKNADTNDQE